MARVIWNRHVPLTQPRYCVWEINPGLIEGEGMATEYDEYLPVDPPTPEGEAVFSVPGVELNVEAGGSPTTTVEFWNDEEKLSEAAIHSLLATEPPLNYTDYGLFSSASAWSVDEGDTGEFFSTWKACGPIPPGEGLLLGAPSVNGDGTLMGTVYWGYYGDKAGSATLEGYLELCDADKELVLEIPILSMSFSYADHYTELNFETIAQDLQTIAWGSAIAFCRVRLEITAASGTTSSFGMGNLNIRRFYA